MFKVIVTMICLPPYRMNLPYSGPQSSQIPMLPSWSTLGHGIQALPEDQLSSHFLYTPYSQALPSMHLFLLLLLSGRPVLTFCPSMPISTPPLPGSLPWPLFLPITLIPPTLGSLPPNQTVLHLFVFSPSQGSGVKRPWTHFSLAMWPWVSHSPSLRFSFGPNQPSEKYLLSTNYV